MGKKKKQKKKLAKLIIKAITAIALLVFVPYRGFYFLNNTSV